MPACLGRSGLVRASSMPKSAVSADGVPHLLPADPEDVAVGFGARRQAGQVGAGTGLAEQLAPRCRPVGDRADVASASAPRWRGRGGSPTPIIGPLPRRRSDQLPPGELLADDPRLGGARGPVRRGRSGQAGKARPASASAPHQCAQGHLVVPRGVDPRRHLGARRASLTPLPMRRSGRRCPTRWCQTPRRREPREGPRGVRHHAHGPRPRSDREGCLTPHGIGSIRGQRPDRACAVSSLWRANIS